MYYGYEPFIGMQANQLNTQYYTLVDPFVVQILPDCHWEGTNPTNNKRYHSRSSKGCKGRPYSLNGWRFTFLHTNSTNCIDYARRLKHQLIKRIRDT